MGRKRKNTGTFKRTERGGGVCLTPVLIMKLRSAENRVTWGTLRGVWERRKSQSKKPKSPRTKGEGRKGGHSSDLFITHMRERKKGREHPKELERPREAETRKFLLGWGMMWAFLCRPSAHKEKGPTSKEGGGKGKIRKGGSSIMKGATDEKGPDVSECYY